MIQPPRLISLFPELSYRLPLRVWKLMVFPNTNYDNSYYVCPRCDITLEREFMAYCDRCGQKLDWSMHTQAKIVYPGKKKCRARAKKL